MNSEILTRFLTACEQDASLLEFAKNRQISVSFHLSDANQEFFLNFAKGEVKAGLGMASAGADLTVRTTAEVFDSIMTGKINGVNAAMSGRLRFSGDTMKGMALQSIIKDMIRLYTQAKGELPS